MAQRTPSADALLKNRLHHADIEGMSRNGSAVLRGRTDHVSPLVAVVAVVVGLVLAYLVVIAFVGGPLPGADVRVQGSVLLGLSAVYCAPIVLFAAVWATDKLVSSAKHSPDS